MKKHLALAGVFALIIGVFACGRLPNNATEWLKQYSDFGNEAVESAKKAAQIKKADKAAVEAHNRAGEEYMERFNKFLEDGKAIIGSLNESQQKEFQKEINKIDQKIRAEKEKYSASE